MTTVKEYYENKESRLGYQLFLKGAQHFGLYPLIDNSNITEWEAQQRHHDRVYEKLEVISESKVLDIGCGRGIVARDLANRYGLKITGIDLTPYIVKEARKNSIGIKNRPSFIEGSYQALPFDNDSFDGLYAIETLSHATDLKKALQEALRVIKRGSKVVFFEYMINPKIKISEREKQMYNLVKEGSAMNSLDLFKEDNFKYLMEKTGFTSVKMTDISQEAKKSFRRLYKYALIPYFFIKILRLQNLFINSTAAIEYFKLAKKRYLNYVIYEGRK